MLVVLDLSAPLCIKHGVQFCNCPEGFLSIKEMHPEDDFCFADEMSKQSFAAFMDFMETMGFTSDDWFAETYFWDNEYDPNDFHVERSFQDELLEDEYYAELQEAYDETIYSLKYSFN